MRLLFVVNLLPEVFSTRYYNLIRARSVLALSYTSLLYRPVPQTAMSNFQAFRLKMHVAAILLHILDHPAMLIFTLF